MTDEMKAAIKDSLSTIAAKAQALYLSLDAADEKMIDRLMRDVIAEAHYVTSKCYQSEPARRLVGMNLVDLGPVVKTNGR